jgi:hypothetical protein
MVPDCWATAAFRTPRGGVGEPPPLDEPPPLPHPAAVASTEATSITITQNRVGIIKDLPLSGVKEGQQNGGTMPYSGPIVGTTSSPYWFTPCETARGRGYGKRGRFIFCSSIYAGSVIACQPSANVSGMMRPTERPSGLGWIFLFWGLKSFQRIGMPRISVEARSNNDPPDR